MPDLSSPTIVDMARVIAALWFFFLGIPRQLKKYKVAASLYQVLLWGSVFGFCLVQRMHHPKIDDGVATWTIYTLYAGIILLIKVAEFIGKSLKKRQTTS